MKFLDKLKRLFDDNEPSSSGQDVPRAGSGTAGARSRRASLQHQDDRSEKTSTPLNKSNSSLGLGKSSLGASSRSHLRKSLDTATEKAASSKLSNVTDEDAQQHHARSKSMGRGGKAEPSITNALDPSLSSKIKDMVFVEVPVCVDHSDANAETLQRVERRQGHREEAKGPQDMPSLMSRAFDAGEAAYAEQGVPKVQRMRSLPMMLDTSMQHHGALQAQAQAEGKAVPGVNRRAAESLLNRDDEPSKPGDTWAQVERTLLPTRRHTSLKMLLNLDNYDFFTDVNVAEAQDAMAASQTSSIPGETSQQGGGMGPELQPQKESNILAMSEALPRGMYRPVWSLNDYIVIKKLHQGYASSVYFSRCNYTQELVVLKVYRLNDQGDLERVQLYREIRVHSKLQHQNIAQFYAAFLEKKCVIIVQEYAAGGDLLRFMYKSGGRLPERQAVNLVLQPFLSALLHLHSQGIIHRDIKPENCLLTDSRVLKLADFGLAVDLREERANTRAGTLEYMSPETLRCPTKKTPDQFKKTPGAQHYEMGADVWAVGTFAYELIVGSPPFKSPGGEMIDTARNIISVNVTYPSSISEMARSFISSCLRKHSGDRPTVVELLQHPWIQMFKRRSSVHMPGEVAQSPLSADLQKVAMGNARGIGLPSQSMRFAPVQQQMQQQRQAAKASTSQAVPNFVLPPPPGTSAASKQPVANGLGPKGSIAPGAAHPPQQQQQARQQQPQPAQRALPQPQQQQQQAGLEDGELPESSSASHSQSQQGAPAGSQQQQQQQQGGQHGDASRKAARTEESASQGPGVAQQQQQHAPPPHAQQQGGQGAQRPPSQQQQQQRQGAEPAGLNGHAHPWGGSDGGSGGEPSGAGRKRKADELGGEPMAQGMVS